MTTTAVTSTGVATREVAAHGDDALLMLALQKEVNVETIERLVALRERAAQQEATRQLFAALADFQQDCPPIPKSSTAKITTRTGTGYSYNYAELDEIAATIRPHLHSHGLSYTWDSEVSADGATLTCTCTVRHAAGAIVSARFALPTATSSAMSEQQRYAAALTFAQRKSLTQVLGLVTTEASPDGPQGMERISEEQVANLRALGQEVKASAGKVLAYAGVASLEEIPVSRYAEIIAVLERMRKEAK